MNRVLTLAILFALLAGAIIVAVVRTAPSPTDRPDNRYSQAADIAQPSQTTAQPDNEPLSSNATRRATVARVIDGDTIELQNGETVRYIGIDTPETVHPDKPAECFGTEATRANRRLVAGKQVRLERDVSNHDKYDRLLRYIYVNDTFVNKYLVEHGYAHAVSYPPDVKYQDILRKAQRTARRRERGAWGACTDTTEPASDHTNTDRSSDCHIKGNISYEDEEKIYHVPGCEYYEETVINEEKGEQWFCSKEEARDAGWREAHNCP